jgi:hypothetical protein
MPLALQQCQAFLRVTPAHTKENLLIAQTWSVRQGLVAHSLHRHRIIFGEGMVQDAMMDNNRAVDIIHKGIREFFRPLHQQATSFNDEEDLEGWLSIVGKLTGSGYSFFSSFFGTPNLLYPPSLRLVSMPVNKHWKVNI